MTANFQTIADSMATAATTTTVNVKSIAKTARQLFIDHFRVALTLLVVLHHVAVVYG